jgi:hypothetical protein
MNTTDGETFRATEAKALPVWRRLSTPSSYACEGGAMKKKINNRTCQCFFILVSYGISINRCPGAVV